MIWIGDAMRFTIELDSENGIEDDFQKAQSIRVILDIYKKKKSKYSKRISSKCQHHQKIEGI